MIQVTWLLITNQISLFQGSIATLLQNLFMTSAPSLLNLSLIRAQIFFSDAGNQQKNVCTFSSSVTKFGKISPLWWRFQIIGNFLRVYLGFGKILNLFWQQTLCFWAKSFIVGNGQNWKHNLVTLILTRHSVISAKNCLILMS